MIRLPRFARQLSAPVFAGSVVAAAIALLTLLVPASLLEALVLRSGIAAVVGAAEPPLGLTARVVLALLLGGSAGAVAAAVALVLRAPGEAPAAAPIPVLRRADAHPDAPARRPLFAAQELGTPFLDVTAPAGPPVERALPADLDQPLAAFDPAALLPTPMEPVHPVAPLARPPLFEPGERFEVFPLAPPAPATDAVPPPPRPARSTEATIQSLLERLERGVESREAARRGAAEKPGSLDDTLSELRRMATQR